MPAGQFGGPAPGQLLTSLPGGVGLSAKTSTASYSFGFDPSQVTGLKLWLDARLGITIATGVSNWADQSGNGNTFLQGTGANQPTFNATAINGNPGVVSAAGKVMTCATEAVAQSAVRTVFSVMTPGSGGQAFYQPRSGQGYCIMAATGQAFVESNNVDTGSSMGSNHGAVPIVYEFVFSGVTTALPVVLINGVAQTVTNFAGTGVGTEAATAAATILATGGSQVLGSLLVYDSALSSANRSSVRTYLGARYGVSVLP